MNNPAQILADFFREMLNRLKTKSPVFFKVLMIVAASLTFAGYLPSALQRWMDVDVPGQMISICEAIAKYATGFLFACGLTVKTPTVGQTTEGSEVKVTDPVAMPFTAKKEKQDVAKEVPPPEVLEEVPETPADKPGE